MHRIKRKKFGPNFFSLSFFLFPSEYFFAMFLSDKFSMVKFFFENCGIPRRPARPTGSPHIGKVSNKISPQEFTELHTHGFDGNRIFSGRI